ncbi:TetR/AcrR family transcriptional regulator [Streptomyces sp. SID10853]|uniref:TetR/AcrR family transcriptional regulator n=1 Tax=Streptomyces sp. SID10853 TaxID=2706028 RepID=UPI0013C0CF1E|nr:TetR/AcrR family transcriptional regulator [Streptomyces sp. SID10853]NDZ81612.1 TetR/AcrR family transcriptional regulator [Streptomyces sp. SID10853]
MEDTGTPATGRSRRERPAKPALTRDGIVATAAAIFRSQGLAKVTMRSVAKALDTGHASLYVYVRNTEDLHAQVLDVELGSVCLPDGSRPWRASLVSLLLDYGRVLLSHAEIARMAIRTRPDGPNYAALVEAVLRQLDRGGVRGQTAAWGVDILLQYPAAVAAEHGGTSPDTAPPGAAGGPAAPGFTTAPDQYPHIAALADQLFSGSPQARAEWALNVLIDGLLAAASPTTDVRN